MRIILFTAVIATLVATAASPARAEEFKFKDDFLAQLVAAVPKILAQQDRKTGRFGSGIFIVTDQNAM
jgi:hypothetical protein